MSVIQPNDEKKPWDYQQFLKGHINQQVLAKGKKDDPFCGETPTIGKDYRAYQKYWEDTLHFAMGNTALLKLTVNCEAVDEHGKAFTLKGQKKDHVGSSFVFGCQHILIQDPLSPDGVFFWPLDRLSTKGYYVCPACFHAIERHKYDFGTQILPHCALCFGEKLNEIHLRSPDKVVSLRYKE